MTPLNPQLVSSSIDWVPHLPAHWEVRRLKHLFIRQQRPPREEDEIVTAFRDGQVALRVKRRTEGFTNSLQEIGYQGIRKGDLVIHAMDAFAGAIGVSEDDGKCTPVYSVCLPRSSDVNPRYYSAVLRHMALSGFVNALARGIRERSTEFRWSDAGEVRLPVPPANEQTAIVAFFDRETGKIDALVEEQKRLIELLKEKRQAFISHAVTKGLDPNARMKPSGIEWLGDVPENWDVLPLKYIAQVGNGSTPNRDNTAYWMDGHFPWLNSAVVNEQSVVEAEQFVTQLALEQCHLPIVAPPAVLVGLTGQGRTRGMAALLMIEATINQHLAFVKPRDQRLDCRYLRAFFEAAYTHLRADSEAGSTKGAITCEQLLQTTVPLPSLAEQERLLCVLDAQTHRIDALLSDAIAAVQLLQERRSAIISAAVTGKIDATSYLDEEIAA